jgi:hypothetical protein
VSVWIALGAERAIAKLEISQPPSQSEALQCVSALERALVWIRSSKSLLNLGSCEFQLFLNSPSNDKVRHWLSLAERHTIEGLTLNPTDGFAWTRLAFIRYRRGATGREVATALITSVDVAPNIRQLWYPRYNLLFLYARQMTLEELFVLRRQLRTIWTYSPASRPLLVASAHQFDGVNVLVWAFQGDNDAMDELKTMERASLFP